MPPLQQYVPNVPLQVAKNLIFDGDNGLPVTQMLPIGINGNTIADNPRTGYISRIGAVLSQQIDLYNQVNQTLTNYGVNIANLQEQVAALETSGATMPFVNGGCLNGNEQVILQDAVTLIIEAGCPYFTVLGTPSNLTAAILAEGPSVLNVSPAFSQASAMAGLANWNSNPATIADSVYNLWLSYLDSRAALANMLSLLRPICSEAIVDFLAVYSTATPAAGFFVYFNGYSFIPSGYTDNGSTVTITDGEGDIFTVGVDIVALSQPGSDPLFVGISGTPLDPAAAFYTVTLNSTIISGSYSCTKTVIHTTERSGGTVVNSNYQTGLYTTSKSWKNPLTIATGLPWVGRYADIVATDNNSASILQQGYFVTVDSLSGDITVNFAAGSGTGLNINWIDFK